MKTKDRFYSFFIILALLFWNPLSFHLFYSNTQVHSEILIHIIYWIIFISGILFVVLIRNNKMGEFFKNISLAITIIGIIFASLVVVDRFLGFVTDRSTKQSQKLDWQLFEPNSIARYKTSEYEYIVKINSLGFRDREINIEKSGKFRILCVGDSWTYGWGVNVEDSWPKVLEQQLINEISENIEVLNFGRPDQFSSTYKKYIAKAVPLLKPDLVLVGVLQLDDLAQLYPDTLTFQKLFIKGKGIKEFGKKNKALVLSFVKNSFMNFFISTDTLEVTSNWQQLSSAMINEFDYWQKVRFATLDDSVQSLFRTGDLEPGLLDFYLNFTDRVTIFNDPNHPVTKSAIKEMKADFKEMKDICNENNTKIIFINIPINYFTGHTVIRTPSDVLNPYFVTNNKIDSLYHSVATENDLSYIELTDHFINLADKSSYLFRYDGHPNEKGYAEIAKYIGENLIQQKYFNHILNNNN